MVGAFRHGVPTACLTLMRLQTGMEGRRTRERWRWTRRDAASDTCQPQQGEFSEQSQQSPLGPVPRSAPMMTPVAHPTPAFTDSASTGQFRAHAPHSMQASRSTILDFWFSMAKTACGHTSTHIPQPTHLSASSAKVTTFRRYRNFKTAASFLIQRDEGGYTEPEYSLPLYFYLPCSLCHKTPPHTNLPASHSPTPTTAEAT